MKITKTLEDRCRGSLCAECRQPFRRGEGFHYVKSHSGNDYFFHKWCVGIRAGTGQDRGGGQGKPDPKPPAH